MRHRHSFLIRRPAPTLLNCATTAALALAFSLCASAKEPVAADKSAYSLFHPVPPSLLREMNTDRPDATESPYTVDAGHFQLELDLANFTCDRHTEARDGGTRAWSFLTTNFKLGLTNRMDFQIVAPFYNRVSSGPEGFGDLTFRLKFNFWGDDGGPTALGLMPFLKVPTAADGLGNDRVEAGVILPFAAELPGGWDFGTMLELDWLAREDGHGHQAAFVTSITFGHTIIGNLDGYLELFSELSEDSAWVATFDVGVTYALTKNVQLDTGLNLGLTRAAADFNPFVGLSIRF
jgi:hypothetical protein